MADSKISALTELVEADVATTDEIAIVDTSATSTKKFSWASLRGAVGSYLASLAQTLTNKTIALGSNTVSGTTAQFNTANTDGDFATLAGTETLTNKTLTSPVINTPTGIVKGDVGLGNVDNTSDANKPVSTATQTALDLKAPLASPTLTGTPAAPTAAADTNTTQIATTAHVFAERTNTATLTNKTLTAPKFADLGFIADANGNELIVMDTVASAVNEIKVANAATGGNPEIAAQGGDTNINLQLTPKGTGIVKGELKRFMVRLLGNTTDTALATTVGGDYRISSRAITVKAVGAYVDTAGTTNLTTIDINEAGTTILSTKITIDSTEKSSETAATPPVISDSAIAADAIVTFDVDAIQTTAAKGLTVWIDYTFS